MIIRSHTRDVEVKGRTRHCVGDDPQCEIRSDNPDHIAMLEGRALTKIKGNRRSPESPDEKETPHDRAPRRPA